MHDPSPRARTPAALGARHACGLGLATCEHMDPMHPQVTLCLLCPFTTVPHQDYVTSTVLQTGAALRAVQGIRGNRETHNQTPCKRSTHLIPSPRRVFRKQFSMDTCRVLVLVLKIISNYMLSHAGSRLVSNEITT